eukprot:TRINITY_DN93444_c0_g1_i1.p1 TRINITY_DN93444_c0_g1~~TRINITY_DN93444_c0_g1_i1.p1  ORF type:complete len:169 (+),score=14.51 TRINITY_DN93444_c0_g1_i1:51-509(+)
MDEVLRPEALADDEISGVQPVQITHETVTERLEYFFVSHQEFKDKLSALFTSDPRMKEIAKSNISTNEEQPLHFFEAFKQYAALLEAELEKFLAQEGIPQINVVNALADLPEDQREQLISTDYLSAALEYKDFLQFMSTYYYAFTSEDALSA